jgi:hypothetical protein
MSKIVVINCPIYELTKARFRINDEWDEIENKRLLTSQTCYRADPSFYPKQRYDDFEKYHPDYAQFVKRLKDEGFKLNSTLYDPSDSYAIFVYVQEQ